MSTRLYQRKPKSNTNETIEDSRLLEKLHLMEAFERLTKSTLPHKHVTYNFGLEETCLTQYSVKRRMRIFENKKVKEVVTSELRKLHDKQGITPTSTLTSAQKRVSLMYLMYLNEKKDGAIRGHGCADRRK